MNIQGHLEVYQSSCHLKTKAKRASAVGQIFPPIRIWQRSDMVDIFGPEDPQALSAVPH